jgi:quinol monooxygenase YgiN
MKIDTNTIAINIRRGPFLVLIILMMTLFANQNAFSQNKDLVVRIAKLEIDPAQLDNYKAALKEHAEIAVRVEPGVLNLYAVYEKDRPTHVTVFEIYANADAYKFHLQTPHFKRYKSTTKDMVKSLELTEVAPIALETKYKTAQIKQ